MSIESMTIALHHSRAVGTPKVVLLGIANHDGDGGSWPSIATLTKYAGVSRGNVQKAIVRLEELGEIRRYVQDGGTASMLDHLRPNRYEVTLRCPPGCDRSRSHNVSLDHVTFDPADLVGEIIEGPWGIASEAPPRIASEAPPRIASEALTVPKEPSKKHPVDRSHDRSRPDALATDRQRRYLRHMVATIGAPWADSDDAEIDSMTVNAADGAIQALMGDYRKAGGGTSTAAGATSGEPS